MAVKPQKRTTNALLDNSEMWKPHTSCPHCPSEELDVVHGQYEDDGEFYQVCCLECGAEGPHGETRKEACKLWDAKHARHRIGERSAAPAHAQTMNPVAENAAMSVLNTPKPPDPTTGIMAAAMASTESPDELAEKQMRKRPFFSLATGLLKPGA